MLFSTRQHMQSVLYAVARPSLRPSHGRTVDQAKTVEVRIMQLSAQSSFTAKLQREHRERGHWMSEG